MAAMCSSSLRQLERHFLCLFHKTPGEWTRNLRLHLAKELIGQGWSSKAVAEELAFTDGAHLCREFKKCAAKRRNITPQLDRGDQRDDIFLDDPDRLTRAALSTGGRPKSKFLSVISFSWTGNGQTVPAPGTQTSNKNRNPAANGLNLAGTWTKTDRKVLDRNDQKLPTASDHKNQ